MKVLKPNAEIWEQGYDENSIWEHIARCTRVCYQSSPNDNESAKDFVKRTIMKHSNPNKNHLAMLEHGTVYLTFCTRDFEYENIDFVDKYELNKYSDVVKKSDYPKDQFYITTNMRVIVENGWYDDLLYICKPTYHHRRVTISFTTNIGVSREFNRHRVNSIAEESTRYCRYSNPKFGRGITVIDVDDFKLDKEVYTTNDWLRYMDIILNGIDARMKAVDWYIFSLLTSEHCYLHLLDLGYTPQQARRVLSLDTKTQLVHTAFVEDWKHFFDLRVEGISGPPHPDAKAVASIALEKFINIDTSNQ